MDYKFKDVLFFLGKNKNDEVVCEPFIFNKRRNKIKLLLSNKIVEIKHGDYVRALQIGSGLEFVDVVNLSKYINFKNLGISNAEVSDELLFEFVEKMNESLKSYSDYILSDTISFPEIGFWNGCVDDDYKKF